MRNGWKQARIGDRCEVIAGQSPEGKSYNATGNGTPFYQGKKDFGEKFVEAPTVWTTEPTKMARQGDILMSVRAPVGPINFATCDLCIGRGLAAIRTGKDLDAEFLFYQLLSLQPKIAGNAGAVFPSINKSEIEAIQLAAPPLPDQRRIVGILDKAFAAVATAKANTEKNLQNARALFDSCLETLFAQQNNTWTDATVGDLVEKNVLFKPFDGNHGELHPKKSDYVTAGVPFIMAADLQNGEVDTQHCRFLPRKLADSLRVGFAKDQDVLLSHKGTIGRSAILMTQYQYVMLTPQVTSYRVKDYGRLLNRFLRYYFMSRTFQEEVAQAAEGGATRAYVGITKQLSLRLRFPPLEEQKRAVARLDSIGAQLGPLQFIYQERLSALDDLRRSLLYEAFTGAL